MELRIGGEAVWAREVVARAKARREAEQSGFKDLIPTDRSALTKAHKSAADDRALAAQGCYDDGFYDATGPPEAVRGIPDPRGGGDGAPD